MANAFVNEIAGFLVWFGFVVRLPQDLNALLKTVSTSVLQFVFLVEKTFSPEK